METKAHHAVHTCILIDGSSRFSPSFENRITTWPTWPEWPTWRTMNQSSQTCQATISTYAQRTNMMHSPEDKREKCVRCNDLHFVLSSEGSLNICRATDVTATTHESPLSLPLSVSVLASHALFCGIEPACCRKIFRWVHTSDNLFKCCQKDPPTFGRHDRVAAAGRWQSHPCTPGSSAKQWPRPQKRMVGVVAPQPWIHWVNMLQQKTNF